MRLLPFFVLGIFVFQTTFAPLARAKEATPELNLSPDLEKIFDGLDRADLTVTNEAGAALTPTTFLEQKSGKFAVETEGIRYLVKVNDADHLSYSVVASDSEGMVLARRHFSFPTTEKAEDVKLEVQQTAESMDRQIQKQAKTKSSELTTGKAVIAVLTIAVLAAALIYTFHIINEQAGDIATAGALSFAAAGVCLCIATAVMYALGLADKEDFIYEAPIRGRN